MTPDKERNRIYQAAHRLKDLAKRGSLIDPRRVMEVVEMLEVDQAEVILFKPGGKYYTVDYWRVPEGAIGPYDLAQSPDFRRIGNGAVLVTSDRWGFPHLFPEETRG